MAICSDFMALCCRCDDIQDSQYQLAASTPPPQHLILRLPTTSCEKVGGGGQCIPHLMTSWVQYLRGIMAWAFL